jgi:trimethylamine:corrinoid methyltransferase-like protein
VKLGWLAVKRMKPAVQTSPQKFVAASHEHAHACRIRGKRILHSVMTGRKHRIRATVRFQCPSRSVGDI